MRFPAKRERDEKNIIRQNEKNCRTDVMTGCRCDSIGHADEKEPNKKKGDEMRKKGQEL
jgi:hypothetical protein